MKLSFDSIGQWCATFVCGEGVAENQTVKVGAPATAAGCADGDAFCGVAASIAHDGGACSVQLGGMATLPYTGMDPAVGYTGLSANGAGGVKADAAGRVYLVADVDTAAKTVTFVL